MPGYLLLDFRTVKRPGYAWPRAFLNHRRRASVFREFSRRATVAGNPLPSGFDTAWLRTVALADSTLYPFQVRLWTAVYDGSLRELCGRYNTNSPPSSIEEKRYGDGETEEEAERCWDEIKRAMGSLILLTGSSVRLSSVALPILVRICDDFLQILVELNRSCAILTFQ